jgi:Holliday junction resolvase RusA-like endonuclease
MQVSFTIPGRLTGKGRPKFSTGALSAVIKNALTSLRERAALVFEQRSNDPEAAARAIRELPLYAPDAKFDGNPAAYVHVYTPPETQAAEGNIKIFAQAAMQGRPPMEGPVWLDIRASLVPPVSWSKARRAAAFFVTGKPDLDNILKLVGDAGNGVCWVDDAQIAGVFFVRTFDPAAEESVTISCGTLADRKAAIPTPDWASPEFPLFSEPAA